MIKTILNIRVGIVIIEYLSEYFFKMTHLGYFFAAKKYSIKRLFRSNNVINGIFFHMSLYLIEKKLLPSTILLFRFAKLTESKIRMSITSYNKSING